MPAKLSKEVTDRFRSCLYVLSALRLEGPKVAATVLHLVRPELGEDDEEPGFLGPVTALGRKMRAAAQRLVTADEELRTASASEGTLRRRRDQKSHALAQQIVGLRQVIAGQYVAPDLDGLGLQRLRPRDPVTVLRRAKAIVKAFQSDDVGEMLGEALFEGASEGRSHAVELAPALAELEASMEQVNEARRLIDLARVEKNDAMAAYDEIFLRTTRMFEDLCRYAGERELADKVRPSARNPGRTEEEPEGVPDDFLDPDEEDDFPDPGGLPPPGGEPASAEVHV
jgi:hypothetical protein